MRPIATWLSLRKFGSGQPHIMCPMEMYMRTAKKPTDAMRRFLSFGVSRSFRASSAAALGLVLFCAAPFLDAP